MAHVGYVTLGRAEAEGSRIDGTASNGSRGAEVERADEITNQGVDVGAIGLTVEFALFTVLAEPAERAVGIEWLSRLLRYASDRPDVVFVSACVAL